MNPDEIPDSTVPSKLPSSNSTNTRKLILPGEDIAGASSSTPHRSRVNQTPKLIFKSMYPSPGPQSNSPDSSAHPFEINTIPPYTLSRIAQMCKGIDSSSSRGTFQAPESPMAPVRHFLRPSMSSTTSYPRNSSTTTYPRNSSSTSYPRNMRLKTVDDYESSLNPTKDPLAITPECFESLQSQFTNHTNHSATSTVSSDIVHPAITLHIKRALQNSDSVAMKNFNSNENDSETSSSSVLSDSNVVSTAESPSSPAIINYSNNISNKNSKGVIINRFKSIVTNSSGPKRSNEDDVEDDIEQVLVYSDEDANMSLIEQDDESSSSFTTTRTNSNSQFNDLSEFHGQSLSDSDGARRTQRKRKPTKHFMQDMVIPRLKIRRKQAETETEGTQRNFSFETVDEKIVDSSTDPTTPTPNATPTIPPLVGTPIRGRGGVRGRGTGRGRGRPRGSKNKVERIKTVVAKTAVVKTEASANDLADPEKKDDAEQVDGADSSTVVQITPTRKPRGRGGTRGTRGSRGSRGGTPRKASTPRKKTPKPALPEKKPPLQVFEEETRMSADIKPAVTEKLFLPVPGIDEESRASNLSTNSTSTTAKAKKFIKDLIVDRKLATAETLFEYRWPQNDSNSESYMLQEQISEYLGVTSFKRKYPDIIRRVVDIEERDFLRAHKIVTETQCDLGLTALSSSDVKDIMCNDFPDKYEEYLRTINMRKEREVKSKPNTSTSPVVRDRSAEFMRRVIKNCAKWNLTMNKERKDERTSSFDLQNNTLNYPAGKFKVLPQEATKVGYHPVAVLPGQFCDHYKNYTPTELKYLPLNSVLYGPVLKPPTDDGESEDSQSDSEDSSSDEASSSSSSDDEGLSDQPKGACNGLTLVSDKNSILFGDSKLRPTCKSCEGDALKNKDGVEEVLIHCTKCDVPNHPTCLELTLDMLPFIKKYNWQCTDCKNCIECNDPADEDKMLFCDLCDRGYHIYCVGLRKVPTGRWHCSVCCLCHSCGATEPSQEDRMAEWHHEFKKGEKGSKFFMHSLCISCHKLYKKGQYCPGCLKCHIKSDDKSLLECRKCEKWVHKECVTRPLQSMFGFMCDPCDITFRSKARLPSHVN